MIWHTFDTFVMFRLLSINDQWFRHKLNWLKRKREHVWLWCGRFVRWRPQLFVFCQYLGAQKWCKAMDGFWRSTHFRQLTFAPYSVHYRSHFCKKKSFIRTKIYVFCCYFVKKNLRLYNLVSFNRSELRVTSTRTGHILSERYKIITNSKKSFTHE